MEATVTISLVLLLIGHLTAGAQTAGDPVAVIEIRGVINPLSAQYLDRTLRLANRELAQAVVITLDTPGGLESATREMVQMLMASPVPTVVYVAPRGARATSAGLFIALAADVVAMAPATHIGAAHPIPLGTEISEVMDEKMISEVVPPKAIQDAMTRQMAAERNRRAMVTEANGTREAAIEVAEGEKQAAILGAEGERQATILRAEGDRQAAVLRAEGFASALDEVFKVAQQVDSKTLTVQYLEALKELGAGASTKFIFPAELLNLVRPLSAHTRQALAELATEA